MKSGSLKNAAVEYLKLVASGKISEAYERHVSADLVHHNAYFPGNAKALKEAMEADAAENPEKELEVHRALEDGSEVAVFSHIRQHPEDRGYAVVHIFRFEGRKIVEMWDVGQAVPEDSINENGVF